MAFDIERAFPGLRGSSWKITSPPDEQYNCIAWAAGDDERWWWPISWLGGKPLGGSFWPDGVGAETVESFKHAFETLGYEVCPDDVLERGFEKVAIYMNAAGSPTHAARQLPDGSWTSKLGQSHDIGHPDAASITGNAYGQVAIYMRRRV